MKKSIKFGLIFAAAHTLAVFIALLMSFVGGGTHAQPILLLLFSVDFPASLLSLIATSQLPDSYLSHKFVYTALLLGIVGGAWWFSIGWLVSKCHSRLAVSRASIRFVSGLMISIVVVVWLLGVQFVADISSYAASGCLNVGFPVSFFRGCQGTFSLYWPAMTVSKGALALDSVAWLTVALLFSYYLSRKTRQSAGSRLQERGVTQVLRRPIEIAAQGGHRGKTRR